MSGVYAYCAGRAGHAPPAGLTGLDGRPVRAETVAGLAVWVSDLDAAPRAALPGIQAHNAVVEAAAATATPLPFRFGQWFADDAALADSIAGRRDTLHATLDALDGALEYGVRILDPEHHPADPPRTSGTAYLEGLAQRQRDAEVGQRRARDVAVALREWMGPLVRDERVRLVGAGTLASIAHLVDRHDNGSYERRVREFPALHPGLRFLFSGPWPPYGFVE